MRISDWSSDVCSSDLEKDFERVLTIASQFGFVELDREEDEDGDLFLFLECEQPVDEQSIRALTKKCLQIEILCGVEYDGWGCEARRSEERRVGKEWFSTCSSWLSPDP